MDHWWKHKLKPMAIIEAYDFAILPRQNIFLIFEEMVVYHDISESNKKTGIFITMLDQQRGMGEYIKWRPNPRLAEQTWNGGHGYLSTSTTYHCMKSFWHTQTSPVL